MRLAIATTLLANSLSLSSSSSTTTTSEKDHEPIDPMTMIMANQRHVTTTMTMTMTRRFRHMQRSTSLKDWIRQLHDDTSQRLTNAKQSHQVPLMECVPQTETTTTTTTTTTEKVTNSQDEVIQFADVGILSCGVGKYCLESSSSSLGGFCVSSSPSSSSSSSADFSDGREHRELQLVNGTVDDSEDLFFSAYDFFCDKNSTGYAQNCVCTNVDEGAAVMDVACSQPPACNEYTNMCSVDVRNCYSISFELSLTGPGTYSYTRCFEDTVPYAQKNCYYGSASQNDVLDECTITMDDVTCSSCRTTPTDVQVCDEMSMYCYNTTKNCLDFDCTNTIARKAGNNCDENVYIPPILYYLQTFGCEDLYICPICGGDDFVSTNPGGIINIGDGSTTCAAVAQVALLGGFNETFCREVVIPGVASDCGCIALTPPTDDTTPPPASSPTDVPTDEPSTSSSSTVLPTAALGFSVAAAAAAALAAISSLL